MSLLGLSSPGSLADHRTTFIEGFTQSASFLGIYATLPNADYVDALLTSAGLSITATERSALITGLNNGAETRGSVLSKLADNQTFQQTQFNSVFVLLEYFGYLRRYPDDAGYDFWLNKLNQPGGNISTIEMIKAFLASDEYRQRFGPIH
jgi:hypothetical protein